MAARIFFFRRAGLRSFESALFYTDMSKALIGIVVLIIVAGGGYYLYTTMNASGSQSTGGENATSTPNADEVVQAQEVTEGTGEQAVPGSIVSILYVGRFSDGTIFDSSEAHGNEPLVFQLGAPGIIPGFQVGVNGMRVGGERTIAVPPAMGYGAEDVKDPAGKVIIPGNSTLIFSIKLVKVEPAPASPPAAQ